LDREIGRCGPVWVGVGLGMADEEIDRTVAVLKFLGDRNRLRIVRELMQAERCVAELIATLGIPQPLLSYHLGKLRELGLVRARREAQWVFYSLDPEAWSAYVAPVLALLNPGPLPPQAVYAARSGAGFRREFARQETERR
jgi:DNA-binding transcriptional ArsR family regulator